ncbi:hypothetical protein BDZ45DRAFT_740911 [Acephala macrosclerotiorum]|nr:hypothetical protein BDZ45DRAFT_740911 [Acephala macrosclerotiorum]
MTCVELSADTETQSPNTATMVHTESQDVARYNNGYGDFCFGRWANRPTPSISHLKVHERYWEAGSNGIEVSEVNGFKRAGSFSFFKLPLHLRDEIYRLLLGPLCLRNNKEKSCYIRLRLRATLLLDDDSFDQSVASSQPDKNDVESDLKPPHEPKTTFDEYEKLRAAHFHKRAHDLLRKTTYDLKLPPTRGYCSGDSTDWLYLE